MMRHRPFHLAGFALVAAIALSPVASASGGGGGGAAPSSPSAPSGGAQRTDPAEAYRLGIAALQTQNYREAIRHLREAQHAVPRDATVNYALGLAYVGAGDHRAARRPFERAAEADDAPVATRLQLGLVYIELGEREKAVEQQTALAGMIGACADTCTEQRRNQLQTVHDALTRALEAPAAAPAADPATTGWNFPTQREGRMIYASAVGLINAERFEEGLDALRQAQAAIGPHPDILNYMGFASRKLGRLDVALGYYQEALALEPNHLGANEYLGELYLQMGRTRDAQSQLARLDHLCAYGCAQREELARWIELASN